MVLERWLEENVSNKLEVSDKDRINVEVYGSIGEWQNHMYTFVNQREPYEVRDVETIPISILQIEDGVSLKRFEESGKSTTYYNVGLDEILSRLDEGSYTHVFLKGLGELDGDEVESLREWLSSRLG